MTTDHEEALRLADKFAMDTRRWDNGLLRIAAFSGERLAALIAEVLRQAMEESLSICRSIKYDGHSNEHYAEGAGDCYDAIRARLEEGK